ncbi:MAG: RibD family protein, partial [Elusimicrobiota bacterium]
AVDTERRPGSTGKIDLKILLRALAERGVASLLVEGGARVHTSFLESGLVDEVRLFLAPRFIGGEKAPGFFGGKGIGRLVKTPWLKEARVRQVGGDFLITGRIERP